MKIGKRNILGKLYRFNFEFLSDNWFEPQTDLCRFMRVIFIWLPLKLLGVLFAIVGLFMALIFIPLYEFGLLLYLNCLAIIAGIIYAGIRVMEGYESIGPEATSVELVAYYYKAVKQRICPIIEIEDD